MYHICFYKRYKIASSPIKVAARVATIALASGKHKDGAGRILGIRDISFVLDILSIFQLILYFIQKALMVWNNQDRKEGLMSNGVKTLRAFSSRIHIFSPILD